MNEINQKQFLKNFKEALELEIENEIQLVDNFKKFNEWDSLAQLSLVAMIDEEYKVELKSEDLDKLNTVEELYLFVMSKL